MKQSPLQQDYEDYKRSLSAQFPEETKKDLQISTKYLKKYQKKLNSKLHWKQRDKILGLVVLEYWGMGRDYLFGFFDIKNTKKYMDVANEWYKKITRPTKESRHSKLNIDKDLRKINSHLNHYAYVSFN